MVSKEEQLLQKEKKRALLRGKLEEAAAICNQLGDIKSRELNLEDALGEHEEELELSIRLGKLDSIAVAHRRVGETLAKMGKYQEALEHHKSYQELAENCGDPVEIQRAWATFGWTYFNYYSAIADEEIEAPAVNIQKLLNRAQSAYSNSLNCAEKLKEKITSKEYNEMKARLLLNMALIYDQKNMIQECSTSLRKAIHLCKNDNLIEDLHRCQYSLACIYFSHGEIDPANSAVDQAMNNAKALKNVTYMTDSLLLKSKLQISKRDYISGKRYAKKAYKTCLPASKESIGIFLRNVIGLCRLLEKLKGAKSTEARCDLHEQIADVFSLVSCFSLAVENYQAALTLAKELGKPVAKIAAIYFSLAQTCADANNYPKAIEYWQKEIECNVGNQKEICSTLLEIAKVKEKQGCDSSSVQETLNRALKAAKNAGNALLEVNCLEKLIHFDKRQEKACSKEILARLGELEESLQDMEDNSDEVTSSNNVEGFLSSIDLDSVSDFSDSDDDTAEKNNCQRRTIQIRKNEKGETPLHRACMSGNLKQVKKLIQQGHPVNPRDFSGWLPIHEASNYGFKAIVEYLIENGAWINDRGGEYCGGVTPLHDAAVGGHIQVMTLLISKGANVSAVTNAGETPLSCFQVWKKEMKDDLDDDVLKDCAELESLMRHHMSKDVFSQNTGSSRNVKNLEISSGWVTEDKPELMTFDVKSELETVPEEDLPLNDSEDIYNNPLLDSEEIVNNWEDPDVARNEYESAITNLRTKPVRKIEKRPDEDIDNPLHTSDDWIVDDVNKNPKVGPGNKKRKRTLDDYVFKKRTPPEPRKCTTIIDVEKYNGRKDQVQSLPCRIVSVNIEGEVFAVPVPDVTLTFGWLADRAADSYCDKHGMKPKLTLFRKDRAVLSKLDALTSFQDSVVNAEVDMWDDFPLVERFYQACDSLSITTSKEAESEVDLVVKRGIVIVTAGSALNELYLRPFLKAVRLQDNLKSLNFSEINLSGSVLDMFCKSVPSLVCLVHLSLRCCGLDSTKLKQISDTFSNKKNHSREYQLEELDLSFNFLGRESSFLFKSLLSCFKLLKSLNISFCDIGGIFADSELQSVTKSLVFLRELHIFGNRFSRKEMRDYFRCMSTLNFVCLDLSNTFCEADLGRLILEELQPFGASLRVLSLKQCCLNDTDLEHVAKFISRCGQLQEIDLSSNPDVSFTGLQKIIVSAKENDLPLLSLQLLDLNLKSENSLEPCFNFFQSGQVKKLTLSEDMLGDKELLELLQREWSLVWGSRANVSTDIFGSITFSHKF